MNMAGDDMTDGASQVSKAAVVNAVLLFLKGRKCRC